MNILLVDDEPLALSLHKRVLANLGCTSVTACVGAARALEAMHLAAQHPDLILLDLNMPEMDGIEFLRHLVTRDYRGSVILVSGEDDRVLQARKAGAGTPDLRAGPPTQASHARAAGCIIEEMDACVRT